MFKKIKISAFIVLVLLVLFLNQQSLCMDEVESSTPKKILSHQEDNDVLTLMSSVKTMKINNQEDLTNCNQQIEVIYKKLRGLVVINVDLQSENLEQKKR